MSRFPRKNLPPDSPHDEAAFDEAKKIVNLNMKISPTLRDQFKSTCALHGTSMSRRLTEVMESDIQAACHS